MWELDERIDTTGPSLFLECFPPIKMFCCSAQIHISGSDKHRKDIKELAASKADCCLSSRFLCVGQKSCTWTYGWRPTTLYILCLGQRKCFSAEAQTVVLIKQHPLTPNFSNREYKYGWSDWYFSDRLRGLPFWSTTSTARGTCAIGQNASDKSRPTPTRATDARWRPWQTGHKKTTRSKVGAVDVIGDWG